MVLGGRRPGRPLISRVVRVPAGGPLSRHSPWRGPPSRMFWAARRRPRPARARGSCPAGGRTRATTTMSERRAQRPGALLVDLGGRESRSPGDHGAARTARRAARRGIATDDEKAERPQLAVVGCCGAGLERAAAPRRRAAPGRSFAPAGRCGVREWPRSRPWRGSLERQGGAVKRRDVPSYGGRAGAP